MNNWQLHRAQIAMLEILRHAPSARFSDLMKPSGMLSDVFKFHVVKLVKLGYIEKNKAGAYRLTAQGKEFANNLDQRTQSTQKQPKLSVFLVVERPDAAAGSRSYLFQKRLRHPYYGYWGSISGPVGWGEPFEAAATRELYKQTGLSASFTVRGFRRTRDYLGAASEVQEDKLFVILGATDVTGELAHSWKHGENAWMTLDELKQQPDRFAGTDEMIEGLTPSITYLTQEVVYDETAY